MRVLPKSAGMPPVGVFWWYEHDAIQAISLIFSGWGAAFRCVPSLSFALGGHISMQDSRALNRVRGSDQHGGQPRRWRATLLSGTALAAFMASGLLFTPTDVLAACSDTGGSWITPDHTTNCNTDTTTNSGNRDKLPTVNIGNGVNITGEGMSANGSATRLRPNATFNNNGNVTSNSPNINGVDVRGYTLGGVPVGTATYNGGGSVTGGQHGINLQGSTATTTTTGGNIIGNNGNGINSAGALANDVNLTNTTVSGSNDGINLSGATSDVTTSGGSITGIAGN